MLVSLLAHGIPSTPTALLLEEVRWAEESVPVRDAVLKPDGTLVVDAAPPSAAAMVEDPAAWKPSMFDAIVPGRGHLVLEQAATTTYNLEAWSWQVGAPAKPTLWATKIAFPSAKAPVPLWRDGNLLLRVEGRLSRNWYFNTPWGALYLLRRGRDEEWMLAVESVTGEPPRIAQLLITLSAVGFVLGEELRIDLLHSIREDGTSHGLARLDLPTWSRPERGVQPAALPFLVHPAWTSRFVELLMKFAYSEPDAPVVTAIHHYFSGIDGPIDSRFLHRWLAAEALAKWALANGKIQDLGRVRIADHDKWKMWVASHEMEIRALAIAGKEQSLYDRVLGSEDDRPTPVQKAIKGLGLSWSSDMDEVERTRHSVVHEGAIARPGERVWNRDRRRTALVATMLTAIIAKLIGYDGPVSDRCATEFSLSAGDMPSWWPVGDLGETVDYRGSGTEEKPSSSDTT